MRTLQLLGVGINDLYTLTKNMPESYRSDTTDFNTNEDTKYMGDQVLRVICQKLNISAKDIRVDDF